ncbi:MAG: DUF6588 family protein [Spirosomataceae bacterium]
MKRLLISLTLLLGAGMWSTASAQKVDEIISSYSGANAKGFLQPLADVMTSTFNTGQAHKTSIDSGFHLYLGVVAFSTFILDDKLKYFTGTTDRNFSPQQSAQVSTLVGPSKYVTVNGTNGTSYTFPAGLGLKYFSLAVPQITLGNVMGTELNVRFIAIDLGGDFGKISLMGGGLRHDLTRYLPKGFPLTISAEYSYQQFKAGDYVSLTTHKAGIYAGQQGKIFNYFAYVGYQNGSMNIRYNDSVDVSPISIDLTNKNPLLLGVGAGMKLSIFRLYVQGSFISPVVAAGGIGLSF